MSFAVLLTYDAARDLDELYSYIAEHDSPRKTDYVLNQIENTFSTLSEFPERGVYPKEMLKLRFKNIARSFSNLTGSFTELWIRKSMFC